MSLPAYNKDISLEEALNQFDYATSKLVLHPFNEDSEDTYNRRKYILETATDANNASSRWIGVLEKKNGEKKLDVSLSMRYLRDTSTCMKKLMETKEWYARIESIEIESNPKSFEIERIKTEKNIIGNYIDLMGVRYENAREMIKRKN
jgi:hypothetical protein